MMHARTLLTFALAAPTLFAAAGARADESRYRGMFVCEKAPMAPDILRAPLDLLVRDGNVQFARPLFNLDGTRVIGSELGSGTVDVDGKVHLTSTWYFRGVTFQGDYAGALTASGGTLTGNQAWSDGQNIAGKRTCTGALVTAPKARQAAAQ
jgi:hypothetical protein